MMNSLWLSALLSVFLVSSISLLGVFGLGLREATLRKFIPPMIGLAVGALYGDALIHLLPDSFARGSSPMATSLYVLLGLFASFTFEKLLQLRGRGTEVHQHSVHPAAFINLFGSSVHNFIDGILIGTAYLAGPAAGVATTLAVVLHEVPHELGDFGILVHSGLTVKRAILLNFLSGLIAVAGTVVALALGTSLAGFSQVMLPVTAGTFIYLAGTDLMPELLQIPHTGSRMIFTSLMVAVGIGLMVLVAIV